MVFSKPYATEYPSNGDFCNAGTIHNTDADETAQFMREEVLFLNYTNDDEKKAKELILQYAHIHRMEGAMELGADSRKYSMENRSFIHLGPRRIHCTKRMHQTTK